MTFKFTSQFKKTFIILLLILVWVLGWQFGIYFKFKTKEIITPIAAKFKLINQDVGKPNEVDFSLFWEAWQVVENEFLDKSKIDYQKMVYGAINGMIKSLGDPHTSFFTPEKTKEFEEELLGRYEGVGMHIDIKKEKLKVISPLKNTPAERAGLRPGDEILKINDTYTFDLTLDEAVSLIRGPKGTEVTLLISREGWAEPKEFKLIREGIQIPSLEWEIKEIDNSKIAYLKIYQFNQILPAEFKKAAIEILNTDTNKIILDLRSNPGGYLEVAQEIAGWFLEKGQTVVWQESKEEESKIEYKSEGPANFSQWKMVILINEGTASGAEILAGALRDNRNILLIGETSFGKGSVQEKVSLKNNSSLKITIAKWLTPKGHLIENSGLQPDIEVKLTEKDYEKDKDPQLEKAIEIIKNL